jgi:hypothetical protein
MAEQPVSEDPVHWDMGDAIAPVDPNTVEPEEPHEIVSVVHGQSEDIENLVAESDEAVDVSSPLISFGLSPTTEVPTESLPSETSRGVGYQVTDLSAIQADPDRFHDFVYRSTLRAMVDAIIECEAPLREDILAQRIARAHGWLRTGNKIRERIMLQLREVDRTSESSGNFVWKLGTVTELLDYRHPRDTDSRRAIPEIPLAELAAFVVGNVDLLGEPDPALGLARLLGVERLAGTSRSRLQEAIERAQIHITVSSNKSGSRS